MRDALAFRAKSGRLPSATELLSLCVARTFQKSQSEAGAARRPPPPLLDSLSTDPGRPRYGAVVRSLQLVSAGVAADRDGVRVVALNGLATPKLGA